MTTTVQARTLVAHSLAQKPIIGVVRTGATDEAARQARALAEAGIELIEITFTVPGAAGLVRQLRQELSERRAADRADIGPPWIGMGTVTTASRAREALAAEADFLVSPNVDAAVAKIARQAGLFLVLGALTPTEIVAAHELEADLVKVYPLPPVGGPAYLTVVRQPLGYIPMLAAGGFGIDDIPAYRLAGASAFGIGFPLLAGGAPMAPAALRQRVARALRLAAGGSPETAQSSDVPGTGGASGAGGAGEERA